ncbi:MAG: immunoglobulin domain-containing protein, partial [Rhodoferax sp.]|nr:immunoglobulin domain-containing protein [Rhodoferax sp.]
AASTPSITSQPGNQSVVAGQTATFSVVATGSATLSYQWKKNDADIQGATSSTYTTPATVIEDSGAVFTVVVKNSAGKVTSDKASLTVSAIVISTQPAAQTVVIGQTASFSVGAAGTGTLSYQWKKNGTEIPGATSSTYTTPATVIGDSGAVFTVVVKNSAGEVTSDKASLTAAAVVITTPPANKSVVAGQTASFTVTAAGTGPLTYQWKRGASTSAQVRSLPVSVAQPALTPPPSPSLRTTVRCLR